ncbi:MAG: tetrahydrofolate dehydrogenase/cyclohydrolase catalytic domain-containing protein [Syntrophomonadaceae bacterium]|jgi:methylenetetrahydrofolate dehydrogenase (NADP+)/methenyltetrahydrofolate cyclohydrolase
MEIINGNQIAKEIKESLRDANKKDDIKPVLAIIVVGGRKEDLVYVGLKEKAVTSIGGKTRLIALPEYCSKQALLNTIGELNQDQGIDGIIVQLPLPGNLEQDTEEILTAIKLEKDVDGFNPVNRGRLAGNKPEFVSCAALGCLEIIDRVYPCLQGKKTILVGDSFDVTIPLAILLLKRQYPVSIYPYYQDNLVNQADILVVEKGTPHIIKGSDIEGTPLIIDAGFYWDSGTSCGNVDRKSVANCQGYLLPVPGGLGPLLIAKLCENLSRAARRNWGRI